MDDNDDEMKAAATIAPTHLFSRASSQPNNHSSAFSPFYSYVGGGDKTKTKRYTGKCNICNKTGHKGADCFQNPNSPNYRPTGQSGGGEPAKKRKFDSSHYNKDPKFQKWKQDKKQYDAFLVETANEEGYIEE